MYAKWIKDTVSSGAMENKRILIKKDEIRKIKTRSDDGYYILEGVNGEGSFGWVNIEEIQILEYRNEVHPDEYILHCSKCVESQWVEIKADDPTLRVVLDLKTDQYIFKFTCPLCGKRTRNNRSMKI